MLECNQTIIKLLFHPLLGVCICTQSSLHGRVWAHGIRCIRHTSLFVFRSSGLQFHGCRSIACWHLGDLETHLAVHLAFMCLAHLVRHKLEEMTQ